METKEIYICDFGCGKIAIKQFKTGNWCCSPHYRSCPGSKGKYPTNKGKPSKRKGMKGKFVEIIKENPGLCEYGCGMKAEHYFKTVKKWCCSDQFNKCPNEKLKRIGDKNSSKRPEVRKKLSESNMNHFVSLETKQKISKKMVGHCNLTTEFIENLREEMLNGRSDYLNSFPKKGFKNHKEWMLNGGAQYIGSFTPNGENHHAWIRDRKERYLPYTEKFFDKKFREEIVKEQNFICPICGDSLKIKRADLHHINYNKGDDSRKNLIMLCIKCHIKTNHNRNGWEYQLKLLNERDIIR